MGDPFSSLCSQLHIEQAKYDALRADRDALRLALEEANRMRDWHSDCADTLIAERDRLRAAIERQLARMAEDRPDWADMQILRDAL